MELAKAVCRAVCRAGYRLGNLSLISVEALCSIAHIENYLTPVKQSVRNKTFSLKCRIDAGSHQAVA